MAVTLVAIKRWIMGTPQSFPATADDSEHESKLGIGPFDFSKIWQLLDTTDQNYSKNQSITERNCYSGILIHAFFDSPQVRKPYQVILYYIKLSLLSDFTYMF